MRRIVLSLLLVFVSLQGFAEPLSAKGLCWFNFHAGDGANAVFSIFRDSSGRNWVGSTSGLYLFDGYQSYAAKYDSWTFRAQIYAMVEHDGFIFLGTNDGLFTLDPDKNTVRVVEGAFPREIRALLKVGNELWIGSLGGLYRYNLVTGAIADVSHELPHHAVYSLLESAEGKVYIGTYDGLCVYNPAEASYGEFPLPRTLAPGGNVFVNAMVEDVASGILYLGTEGALFSLDVADGTVGRQSCCDGNSVKSLALSGLNVIAGTDNGLVFIPDAGAPTVFRHDSRTPYSIASNVVWSLFADDLGNVWCGTEVGVSIIDYRSPVRVYSLADITGISAGQQVFKIFRDSDGSLWLGGTNGVIMFGVDGDVEWFMPGNAGHSLSHNRVRDIIETSEGDVWVATDGGLNIFDRRTKSFVNHRVTDFKRRLNANWAYGILEDTADSTIWVAGYLGGVFREKLSRFHAEGLLHRADTVLSVEDGGIHNNLIGQIVQDAARNKWVLHFRDSSLTRIDGRTCAVSRVNVRAVTGEEPTILCPDPRGGLWCGFYGGVAHIGMSGAVGDDIVHFPFGGSDETVRAMASVGRNLWVATTSAVWEVDAAAMKARVLPLPAKAYTAIYYDKQLKEVILGAVDEIVTADPSRLLSWPEDEEIAMLRIREGGMQASIDYRGAAAKGRFDLPSDNRDISVDLVTAYFSPSQYLRFCYRLDGDKWQLLPDGDNCVRLTSLVPGRHKMEFAIAGVEASTRKVDVVVAEPWYRTNLAWALYAIVLAGAVVLIVRETRRRHRRRIEEMERTNALAAVENRLFFLSNISHELKTPLSMIIGPLSKVRTGEDAESAAGDIETAYQSALKLNTLIHQTVEINRMELRSENMLIYSRIDVVEFCRDIFDNYRRSEPGRTFVFSAEQSHIYARTDAVKLESLVTNLLSNAVKYTSDGSTVALSVSLDAPDFEISVSDDGVGIPQSEQSLVFQRLYRSPRTAGTREGTGIGLYLVRQYAQLLGGSVTVASRVDEGSTFTLRLPLGEVDEDADTSGEASGDAASDKRKRVLIVDDNRSIASFISSLLSKDYNCAVAANGKAGLTVAASFRPDIIISDEMMPVMSGLEMSRRLKDNPSLAAIPILLLTAKDTPGIHGESIANGIDAFMPKPFDAPALVAKVAQLIGSGERMRQNMMRDALTASETEPVETFAEKQLAEVSAVVENNLSNPDLNVDFVCRAVDMNQKSLYRLLKKYVGVSPVDYIRQMRLRKAAMLLEQKKFSVSEVMYMVGFSSSSYFSKCFTAMFGCSPGQYPGERPADG